VLGEVAGQLCVARTLCDLHGLVSAT
jgi:hypothetical protein